MWTILADTVFDALKTLPFLFAAYLIIEYVEHKKSHKIEALLTGTGKLGFLGGALLGCMPQCGFSVAAANFYAGRVISAGTLVAVLLATSDEAIPVLLTRPESWGVIVKLLLTKILIAVIAGFFTDLILRKTRKEEARAEHIHEDMCEHCGCEQHSIVYAALKHTASIFFFILLVSLLLNTLITWVGEGRLSVLMQNHLALQPVIAALIGLIPNCASSVVLTELLLSDTLSFGAAVSGLCAGAGIGFLVLFRVNRHHMKENFLILGIVMLTGILSGFLLQWLGI